MVKPEALLWFSDARGVYIPRDFASEFSRKHRDGGRGYVEGTTREQFAILEEGPTQEDYWGTWDDVLRDARVIDRAGNHYTLHQDGDLWFIPVGMEWNEKTDFWRWPTDEDKEDANTE